MSNDYHDYVIKDGKFVGDFETMYQNCENPWNQINEATESYIRAAVCMTLKKYSISSLNELGCGLGETTAFIKKYSREGFCIRGIDISKTAIDKARKNHPEIEFEVNDVKTITAERKGENWLLAEIMWYILDDLDEIVNNITLKCKGNYVLINQTFYPKGKQQYGTQYFSSVDEMIEYLPWKCIEKVVEYGDNSYDTHTVYKVE